MKVGDFVSLKALAQIKFSKKAWLKFGWKFVGHFTVFKMMYNKLICVEGERTTIKLYQVKVYKFKEQ